jgi:hypothetical protein
METSTPPLSVTSYQTKSPILFIIFNRPDTTAKVFEQIRSARPKRLYITADGPRDNKPDEDVLCRQTREIVNTVDWDCVVKTLYRDKNAGCKNGVSDALNWFFSNEEEGIVLEDDCLPANSFFKFCDELLEKYRDDARVRHMTGCNLQFGKKWGDGGYYFSNRTHVWGWASWRRAWKDYDISLKKYNGDEVKNQMLNIYADPLVAETWTNIFKDCKAGKENSWAYPLDFINFFNNGLVIIPNENLISNIGFAAGATHTVNEDNIYANIPLSQIDEIVHPTFVVPQKEADLSIMIRDFNILEKRRKQNSISKRFKRWLRGDKSRR